MTLILALIMVVLIGGGPMVLHLACLRSPAHFVGWVSGGYAAKIALLVTGLYVPRVLGVDVRMAAIATIIAIIVSSTVEMGVMMRRRTMNVDPRPDDE